jgi:hypothetical protein
LSENSLITNDLGWRVYQGIGLYGLILPETLQPFGKEYFGSRPLAEDESLPGFYPLRFSEEL